MKILIICHEFPPIGGGASNAAFYLARHFHERGHCVTVLTSRFKKAEQQRYAFDVVYLPVLRRYIERTSPLELVSFAVSGIIYSLFNIRRKKFDICLAIHGIPSGWVAFAIRKIFKIPYVVSLRGGDVPDFLPEEYGMMHRKIKPLTNLYWRNAKALIANSEGLKALSEVTSKAINRTVKVIPNGVDCELFEPDYSLRDNDVIRILYAGRVTLQKGLECFIKAIKENISRIENRFEVKIIGEGNIKRHLQEIGVELHDSGILSFSDWLDKKDLITEYKKAHIFILPSLYEGMSNSLLEAMACGCMVISSDIPGSRELVRRSENGFLFKAGDISDLKDVLIAALSRDVSIIEDMGRKSRIIAQGFDWNKVTDLYLKEFYA